MKQKLLLTLALCLALLGSTWAQDTPLAVNITKTDASVIAGTGTSLQEAIGTTPIGEIQKLEITAGSFAATDWQWIFNNRGNLSNLTHFTITDGITLVADIPSEVFNGGIKYISVAKTENIGVHAFFNLKNLKSVEFPDVKNISLAAFLLCDSLSFVNLPKALTIGQQAFSSCKSLTSMYLPELTDLGSTAFQGCIMLSTIRLPKVTSISGNYPFIECSVLTNIMLGATPPAAAETSFASSSNTRYLIPIDEAGNPLTGAELAVALEQYRNANDGNTTDSYWYGNKLGETLFTVTVDPAITHGKVSVGEYQAAGATVPIGVTPDAQHTVTEVWYTTQSGDVQAITGNSFTMPAENITLSATFVPNVLKVLVNGTIEKTGSSLVNALTGISYKSITSLTIYGGHFTLADWQWMQSYKAYFTGLTHFTITNDISSVASSLNTSPFGNQIKEVSIAKLTRIYHGFLSGNTGITHANFPHVNATESSGATFANCTALTSINCPLLHLLVNSDFANCTSLTTAILPGLTRIDASSNKQAFKNCTSLTHLVLGPNPPIGARYEFAESPATRYITIANAQGEELTNAYAAYRAAPDGNTTDNYWYGWQIEGGMERYTLAPSPAITNGQVNLSVWGLLPEGLNSELTIQPAEGYKLTEGSLRAYNSINENIAVAIEKNICGILSLTSQAFDVTVTAQFEGLPQELTVLPAVNGTFSVTPTENIVTGTPITITAVQPATGYRLKEGFPRAYKTDSPETPIALTGNTDGTLSFSMAPYAVTVTVEFELIPYTVSVTADIPHGALAATPCENVTMGTEVTLTITPDAGYKLVENSLRAYKTGDESVTVSIVDGKFTMPAYDVTVTAQFEALPQVLTIATVANGTITATPSEGIVTDTEITLTTTPAEGYKLVENSFRAYKTGDESVVVEIADGKFTMPAFDVTVTAQFEALPQVLTIATVANGTITATPSEGIVTGAEISLTTNPSAGYKLVENSLRAYKTGDESVAVAIVDGKFTMPAYDVTVTAEFEALPQVLTVATVANGTITATPSEGIVTDTEIILSTTPAEGYKLVDNSLRAYKTGDESVAVDIVNGKIVMPAYPVTVTAQFEALPQGLTLETVANGTITAIPSEGIVTDTEITLTTNPAKGYKLTGNSLRAYKTGDESVAVAIVDGKFTMPAYDVTVTAEFEALPQVLTMATVANGTITATPSEGIVTDTEIILSTTPAEGYKLTENSLRAYKTGDESVTVSIVDGKFTMPAFDVTATAEFEALPQVLTVATVANGTITATPSEGIVTDTEITLSTTPIAGYKLTENSLRAYKTGDESVTVSIVDGKFIMPAYDVTVTAEFEALPQTLTVQTVANGTITATPSEGIVTGAEITLTTNAAAGYKLVENSLRAYKTGDESVTVSIVDGKFTMPAYDVTVTAEFEALPQVLTMATVANGTITATPSEGIVTDTEITLSTTPAAGYKLTENSLRAYKTGDESVTVTITDNKFAMPSYNVTVTCQFELITGIDDNTAATVSAYPNPFTDYVVIESEEQIRSVSFINLLGKTVQHTSMPETRISTQNLLPGIYLVKLDFAKGKPVVIRMVKQ